MALIPGFRSVVFDCDSTLASVEGIDELAGERIDEIRALTESAMRGEVALEDVYGRRLEIIRPTRSSVERLGRLYIERLVEDARETVAALLWLGKDIRIISGGLRPPVVALAGELGLPSHSVAAVGIQFHSSGEYAGFDRESPLARSGGKPVVLEGWSLARPSILIGDGATDLEARPAVDCFAAYMGIAHRENVAASADVVLSSRSLAPVLALASNSEDRRRLHGSSWSDLLDHGHALLDTDR
ncbi:MAG: HAD-IB family phosphatase [Gemmatimonadota bacterium]